MVNATAMYCVRLTAIAAAIIAFPVGASAQDMPAPKNDPAAVGRAAVRDDTAKGRSDPAPVIQSATPLANALTGVTVGAVYVTGAPGIPQSQIAAAIAPFIGRTFSGDDSQKLLSAISEVARQNGYIFASSRIPAQKLAAGVLRVELAEGYIEEVRLQGDQPQRVADHLSSLVRRPAQEAELERLLTLAADIPGITIGKASYSVENGKGVLTVPVKYDRVRGWASIDNRGSKALGPLRALIGVDIASIFTDQDRLTIQGVTTPTEPNELAVLYGRYAYLLPGAATELALAATYSHTNSGGRWERYDPRGNSIGVNASIIHTLKRGRRDSLWAAADFNYIESDQWWNDFHVQRDRIASLGLSLNGYTPFAGGRLRAGVGVRQGLTIFGATEQGDLSVSRLGAGSDYTIAQAWTNWEGGISGPLSARLAVTTQLSTEPLLAIDQITIGGPYFGRGYDFSERAGDQGVLASGEVRTNLIDRNAGFLRWMQIYVFADAGVVENLRNDFGTGDLYSAGGGTRLRLTQSLRFELEAAFPLNQPRFDAGDESPLISASLGASF